MDKPSLEERVKALEQQVRDLQQFVLEVTSGRARAQSKLATTEEQADA